MDAFYASVEQRDNPELRGKALAVGYSEERGVVAAASYEARKYGVRSAMSSQKAKRLCPHLIFVPGRMSVYKEVSSQIHEIFHEYTDIIEPLSLDEAFLDVTENKKQIPLAVDIAKEIKQRIRQELHLVASAGISYNKFLAKIASDYRKPDGLCTIHPAQALDFIARLPIESFWGVGPVTAKKMHTLGIHNGAELRDCSLEMLSRQFGKAGSLYYECARGIDKGNTLTLKIKVHDFTLKTKSITQPRELTTLNDILPLAKQLLREVDYATNPIRLIGLSVSNPLEEREETERKERWEQLSLEFSDWKVSY